MLRASMLFVIRFYQVCLSPLWPRACRFEPSCSRFAHEAIRLHGLRGLLLSGRRLLSCHPFHQGGWDPVPPLKSTAIESTPHV